MSSSFRSLFVCSHLSGCFYEYNIRRKGKMPQKDNILLLLFPGSHALPVTGTGGMLFQFISQLNISVTNISVCGTTFGQLSPKCFSIIWRCFILYNVSNCEKSFLTVGNTGEYCKFHSYFSCTLIYSIALFLHITFPSLIFSFDWTIACLSFLSPYIFRGMNCSPLSLGSGQEFIFSRSIVSECHL